MASIGQTTRGISKLFRLQSAPSELPYHCDLAQDCSEQIVDLAERFQLWAGNLGAHHSPKDPRSLDRRLGNAPEVSKRIREILAELQDLLEQAQASCGCVTTQDQAENQVLPTSEDDALVLELLNFETSSQCKRTWVLESISDAVRRLFRVSALIAKSTTRDRFARAEAVVDRRFFEPWDIEHVRTKFGTAKAEPWLLERLGKMITKRRQYLFYVQQHHEKLADRPKEGFGLSLPVKSTKPDAISDDRLSMQESAPASINSRSTLAPTKASTLGKVDVNAVDYGFDEETRSQTTMASIVVDGLRDSALKVPPLTDFGDPGEYFECPLCATMQKFNGRSAWERHVYADLRAYVCTAKDCGMLMFETRKAWYAHEMENHWRLWSCQICAQPCRDLQTTRSHLQEDHSNFTMDQIEMLLAASSRTRGAIFAEECTLCHWDLVLQEHNSTISDNADLAVPTARFLRHLGQHLEELSLFVFPWPEASDQNHGGSSMSNIAAIPYSTVSPQHARSDAGNSDATKAPGVEEESTTMHCICGFEHDNSNRVRCDSCNTWQHMLCYYPNVGLGSEHFCVQCDSGVIVDPAAARTRQRTALGFRSKASNIDEHQTTQVCTITEPSTSEASSFHKTLRSSADGWSTNCTNSIHFSAASDCTDSSMKPMLPPPPGMNVPPPMMIPGPYMCDVPECTTWGFQTQYALSSHKNVHSQNRPFYCPVEGCIRSEGGRGFKRKNEMIRHGLVHNSPGYTCPFCPEREHRYPRSDNLKRHVRVHHFDKDPHDPILLEVLEQRPKSWGATRAARLGLSTAPAQTTTLPSIAPRSLPDIEAPSAPSISFDPNVTRFEHLHGATLHGATLQAAANQEDAKQLRRLDKTADHD